MCRKGCLAYVSLKGSFGYVSYVCWKAVSGMCCVLKGCFGYVLCVERLFREYVVRWKAVSGKIYYMLWQCVSKGWFGYMLCVERLFMVILCVERLFRVCVEGLYGISRMCRRDVWCIYISTQDPITIYPYIPSPSHKDPRSSYIPTSPHHLIKTPDHHTSIHHHLTSAHEQDLPPRVKWATPTNEILFVGALSLNDPITIHPATYHPSTT